jgi:hypothetical protein
VGEVGYDVIQGQGEAVNVPAYLGPEEHNRLNLRGLLNKGHMKVAGLLALRTGRLYPTGKISGTDFCQRLSRPRVHCAAGKIKSNRNLKDPIGNRPRHFPACSAVPQPTVLPHNSRYYLKITLKKWNHKKFSATITSPFPGPVSNSVPQEYKPSVLTVLNEGVRFSSHLYRTNLSTSDRFVPFDV